MGAAASAVSCARVATSISDRRRNVSGVTETQPCSRRGSVCAEKGNTMTDSDYTAMLLVIDRSGSMMSIRDDMVGGLNAMLTQQMAEPGLLTVDIVTFDNEIELQCSLANPKDVVITLEPRGGTALLDAVGLAVNGFGQALAALPEHARPGTVQVIVVTDGEENSSHEYNARAVHALVTQQKEKFSWDFVFLGANQDAVLAGATMGFDAGSSMTYAAGKEGVDSMASSVGRYVSDVRGKEKRMFLIEERMGAVQETAEPSADETPETDADGASAA